jgi:hypothetical protein
MLRMVSSAIFAAAALGEEDAIGESLSILESLLLSSTVGLVMMEGTWSASSAIAWEVEMV